MVEFYKKKIENIDYLPVMPTVLTKLLEILNESSTSNKEIAKIIALDSTVSAKILSIANSALFGGTIPVTDLTLAVNRLGIVDVKTIAMTLYVSNMLKKFKLKNVKIEEYWRHNLAVAFICRKISQHYLLLDHIDEEFKSKLYLAGLFHDIGYILFDQINPEFFINVKTSAINKQESFVALENMLMHTDHAEEGAELLKFWKLPEILYEAIRYHHEPIRCTNSQVRDFANIINVADYIANGFEISMINEMVYDSLSENAWNSFSFANYSEEHLEEFKKELAGQTKLFISFLELALSI